MRRLIGSLMALAVVFLLDSLASRAQEPQPAPAGPALSESAESSVEFEAERRILASLEGPISIDLRESPLTEVVDFFAEALDQQVYLDRRALDEAGIAADTPVTASLKEIRARSALDLILEPLELDWTVRKEVLYITTSEHASHQLSLRVYSVGDLKSLPHTLAAANPRMFLLDQPKASTVTSPTPPAMGGMLLRTGAESEAPVAPPLDSLVELISVTVEPTSWDEVGGSGVIQAFGGQFLVVRQTRQAHEQIGNLLKSLRDQMGRQ